MIKQILKNTLSILMLLVLFSSCVKEVDFEQVKELTISPIFESSLIYFDAPATKFFLNGSEISTTRDTVEIDLFSRGFVVNNLIKAEFLFQATNSINRSFRVQVDFLSESNQQKHSFAVQANASPTNSDIIVKHTEVFEGSSLTALKESKKVVLSITALPGGTPLNTNTPGRINLQSKGAFYFKIKDDE